MRAEELHDTYSEWSQKLENRSLMLSLSGLGIVWVFKTDSAEGPWLTSELLLPSLFFVTSVALDLFQAAYLVLVCGLLYRLKNRESEDAFDYKSDLMTMHLFNWPIKTMFYGKFISVVVGYLFLLVFVLGRFD